MNHANGSRVHIVTPYYENGVLRDTPTMREVFERLGFDFRYSPGQWRPEVWANGWGLESDVLSRRERRALGFKP